MRKLLILVFSFISISVSAQTVRVVSGIDTTTTGAYGYDISPHTTQWALTVKNSRFSTSVSGYQLYAGDDLWYETAANNYDGSVITGNQFIYTGTNYNLHNILAGYSVDYKIKFNYFDRTGYGVLSEHTKYHPMAYTKGGITYNVFKNIRHIRIGGTDGLRIYNNTFYTSVNLVSYDACAVLCNSSADTSVTTNLKIKNNIFYRAIAGKAIIFTTGNVLTGFECDYNLYYNAGGNPTFTFNGSDKTWAEWQALGYDAHSVVITDPDFFVDTINFVPLVRQALGVDIGAIHTTDEYDYGLSTTSDWVVGTHPDTVAQNGTWQIGAHVYTVTAPTDGAYYVAPAGNDSDAGTIDHPFKTLQKGFNMGEAGDTVYFREGVYYPADRVEHYPVGSQGHNGTHNAPVCFFAYPGEQPILDGTNFAAGWPNNSGLTLMGSTNVKVKGLDVRNVDDKVLEQYISAVDMTGVGTVWLEDMASHHNGGYGFQTNGYDTVYITNCDAHHNMSDNSVEPGNKADGFGGGAGGAVSDTFKILYMTGCRSWYNSDDGIDLGMYSQYVIDKCWSFDNGHLEWGTGVGFKTAPSHVFSPSKRVIKRCLAAYNKEGGFMNQNITDPDYGSVVAYYNNTVYSCFSSMVNSPGTFLCGDGVMKQLFVNNIIHGPSNYYRGPGDYVCDTIFRHNNWLDEGSWPYWIPNPLYTTTDADFVSVDSTGLSGPRQADGSLPDVDFMKLASTSDLIDKGLITLGYGITIDAADYNDAAPDLGYLEYGYPDDPTDPVVLAITGVSSARTTASITCNVIDDGGGTVSARGVCWSVAENPTTADDKTTNGTGTGVYTASITGLTTGTTYHVRAYATNEAGTSYSADNEFTTTKKGKVKSGIKTVNSSSKIVWVK